jgi:uncharacterized protein YkwD
MKKFALFFSLGILCSILAHADPLPADCYDMGAEACEAFHLTNAERMQNGEAPLAYCPECFAMAQEHSDDMVARGYFSHTCPGRDGGAEETFFQRAERFGLKNWVGENIAMNGSPANVVTRWMNSPGHRKNILNPKYDSFAVGFRDGLYTQVFWKRVAP